MMKQAIIAVLIAAGLSLLLGWSFWGLLIIIGMGIGFWALEKKSENNKWIRRIAIVVSAAIVATVLFGQLKKQWPLTASLGNHISLGKDIWLANNLSDPATKMRATALLLQTAREDEGAKIVADFYRKGEPKKAAAYIKQLVEEGIEMREAIGMESPPKPSPPAENQPATYEPPVRTALLPGQAPAPVPPPPPPVYQPPPPPVYTPPPPKPEFVIPVGYWEIRMLSGQEVWAKDIPEGRLLVDGKWLDTGEYIFRRFGWDGTVLARMRLVGPKRLEGTWLGGAKIKIQLDDERGGTGAVGWGGQENAFYITKM